MKAQIANSSSRPQAAAEGAVCVGDVIAAAFDEASSVTEDHGEAEWLATIAAIELLRAAHRVRRGTCAPDPRSSVL